MNPLIHIDDFVNYYKNVLRVTIFEAWFNTQSCYPQNLTEGAVTRRFLQQRVSTCRGVIPSSCPLRP